MNTNKEILDIVKYFGDVIKELNSSFAALSMSVNSLTQQMEKLPQLRDLEGNLKLSETKYINYFEKSLTKTAEQLDIIMDGIKGLNDFILGATGKIQSEIESIKKNSNIQTVELEVRKQEIDLEKTKIIEGSSIKKSKIDIYGKIVLAILGGSGLISGIIYLLFKMLSNR